jgi:hypothetical protein
MSTGNGNAPTAPLSEAMTASASHAATSGWPLPVPGALKMDEWNGGI